MPQPTEPTRRVIDLCCGLGGWTAGFLAEGFDVLGIDLVQASRYPGRFLQADIRTLDGEVASGATLIVASPPCEQFSRHGMPWTRRRNPPEPDLSCVRAVYRIAQEAGCPLILENVRTAQRWLGPALWHVGPYYLWGTGLPALFPPWLGEPVRHKEMLPSTARAERARIPLGLARWIAACYRQKGGARVCPR